MTNKLLRSLVRIYDDIYSGSPYERLKVVSFLIYKGKIVNFGVNSEKTSPMQKFYRKKTSLATIPNFIDKEHSEINLLRRTYFGEFDMRRVELVVISKRNDGNFRLARPCCTCMRAVKDYGIQNIYYTTNENTIVKEEIQFEKQAS